MKRRYEAPVKLPEMQPGLTDIQKNKLALNFYNYKFLLALEDLRVRWHIEIIEPTTLDWWKEGVFMQDDYLDELAYLISLIPSVTYYEYWLIVHFCIFHNIVGIAVPHLDNWANRFRGDYELKLIPLGKSHYLEVKIYAQLADDDWDELKRAAKNRLSKLSPKTTWKGDDLRMLATLANLARDDKKRLNRGQLAWKLSELGYVAKNGRLFSDYAIDKKLDVATSLGF